METNKKLNVLLITNLFPNNKEPNRGIFIRQAAVELIKLCSLQVVAPVPWFPGFLKVFSKKSNNLNVISQEKIDGIITYHPSWVVIPKFFRSLYGFLFFLSILQKIKEINKGFEIDVIYAPWVYPDGFASVLLGKLLGKPVVLHALGCDVNQYTKYFIRRQLIRWCLKEADLVISVNNAIKMRIVQLGVREDKVHVVPNGINAGLFRPMDMKECRKEVGLSQDEKIILFIGSLEEVKGVNYLVEAFYRLIQQGNKGLRLIIIGKGYMENEIKNKVAQWRLQEYISLIGEVHHNSIPVWMNAADIFCLPSIREGMPNVVLEALACRKPVVATTVGGIPEIINCEDLGILVPPHDSLRLSMAFIKMMERINNPAYKSMSNEVISWQDSVTMVFNDLKNVLMNKENSINENIISP